MKKPSNKTYMTTLKPSGDLVFDLPEEFINEHGLKPGDTVFLEEKNGALLISAPTTVEIDLATFSKEQLIFAVNQMAEKNITPHEFFNNVLKDFVTFHEENPEAVKEMVERHREEESKEKDPM